MTSSFRILLSTGCSLASILSKTSTKLLKESYEKEMYSSRDSLDRMNDQFINKFYEVYFNNRTDMYEFNEYVYVIEVEFSNQIPRQCILDGFAYNDECEDINIYPGEILLSWIKHLQRQNELSAHKISSLLQSIEAIRIFKTSFRTDNIDRRLITDSDVTVYQSNSFRYRKQS